MYFFLDSPPHKRDDGKIPPLEDFEALGLDPNDPQALHALHTIIAPDEVIGAIHRYVEDRKEIYPTEVLCYADMLTS